MLVSQQAREASVETIPLKHVKENASFRLRKELPAIEELASDIEARGLLVPIIVRAAGREGHDLISGYRRVAALRKIGAVQVPALVLDGIGDDEAVDIAVSENAQREDLTPLEKAQMCLKLFERGRTRAQIASLVLPGSGSGDGERNVQKYLDVARTHIVIKDALENKRISFSIAVLLAEHAKKPGKAAKGTQDPSAELRRLVELICVRQMSVRQVSEHLEKGSTRQEVARDGRRAEPRLEPRAPVRWNEGKRGGFRVTISFNPAACTKEPWRIEAIEKGIARAAEWLGEYKREGSRSARSHAPSR